MMAAEVNGVLVMAVDGFVLIGDTAWMPEHAAKLAETIASVAETAQEQREGPHVQVKFVDGYSSKLYTYRDPSGKCRPGDLVQVPSGYSNELKVATVQKLGKGSEVKKAKIVKCVAAILKREVL